MEKLSKMFFILFAVSFIVMIQFSLVSANEGDKSKKFYNVNLNQKQPIKFEVNPKYVTKEHEEILQINIPEPTIRVHYENYMFDEFEEFPTTIQQQVFYIREAYFTHMKQMIQKGYDIRKLNDVQFVIDYHRTTINTGGRYTYVSRPHTTNPNNVETNTVWFSHYKGNNIKNDTFYTLVHEFGHHVGFDKYHFNFEFDDFKNLRRNNTYIANNSFKQYTTTWRNNIIEQFAETYTELFIDGYQNRSATPNLTRNQRIEFYQSLRTAINK